MIIYACVPVSAGYNVFLLIFTGGDKYFHCLPPYWTENMKVFRPLSYSIIALAASLFTLPATAATGSGKDLITVYNPAIAARLADRLPLCPRLDTLEGKTLYMVDVQWGGPTAGYSVLEVMQDWFHKNMPRVKTVLRHIKGNMFTDDPELWKEIGAQGDAAIVGVAQ